MLQAHHDGVVDVTIRPEIAGESAWSAEITAPDGEVMIIPETTAAEQVIAIQNPQLWWPNGLGKQPLYRVTVRLATGDTRIVAHWSAHDDRQPRKGRMGRGVLPRRQRREGVCHGRGLHSGGQHPCARDAGADAPRCLEDCKAANFNAIRVWGGGYYPG